MEKQKNIKKEESKWWQKLPKISKKTIRTIVIVGIALLTVVLIILFFRSIIGTGKKTWIFIESNPWLVLASLLLIGGLLILLALWKADQYDKFEVFGKEYAWIEGRKIGYASLVTASIIMAALLFFGNKVNISKFREQQIIDSLQIVRDLEIDSIAANHQFCIPKNTVDALRETHRNELALCLLKHDSLVSIRDTAYVSEKRRADSLQRELANRIGIDRSSDNSIVKNGDTTRIDPPRSKRRGNVASADRGDVGRSLSSAGYRPVTRRSEIPRERKKVETVKKKKKFVITVEQ